jgi:hypothetical protein
MSQGNIYHWEESLKKGYSIGWSLKTLIQRGMPDSESPQTSDELLDQTLSLIQESKYEWTGPITFNSLDNYIVPFIIKEKTSKNHLNIQIQDFFNKIKLNYKLPRSNLTT